MKVALLIAVVLASVVLADSFYAGMRNGRIRKLYKKGKTFQEKEMALQDAEANLEEVVHNAESEAVLELIFQEVEGNNDALNGYTFDKKVATLQEAAADIEEKVTEVEEDAALGLLEEEVEELEKELKYLDGDHDE